MGLKTFLAFGEMTDAKESPAVMMDFPSVDGKVRDNLFTENTGGRG